ncbi:MinD/ParA family protein [Mycobacterium kubicae]|nr:MinD/ParA family protein [Mycobacterium kubicae]
MSNRGRYRGGVLPDATRRAAPNWRARDDWAAPTVPELRRIDGPRPIQRLGESSAPTPAAIRAPAPVRPRERVPGGIALDGLDQQDVDESAQFSWHDLLWRIKRMDFGPGRGANYELDLRERIRTSVGTAFPIAVLNLKGGVGKTSVVEALGSTLASVRRDPVIGIDLDGGDLSDRHGRRSHLNMLDLLQDITVTRYSDVRAHTYMNSSGFEVLGLPDYVNTNWRVERQDFIKVFSILRKHYSLVLIDCVKALNSTVMEAVLPESRALVVVSSASIDSIKKTKTTLEWLRRNGYAKLIASTVLAVNHTEPRELDTLAGKELEQLAAQVAATVVLPFDRHIHEGREIGIDRLSKESRRCYLELAAAVAERFPGRDVRRNDYRSW